MYLSLGLIVANQASCQIALPLKGLIQLKVQVVTLQNLEVLGTSVALRVQLTLVVLTREDSDQELTTLVALPQIAFQMICLLQKHLAINRILVIHLGLMTLVLHKTSDSAQVLKSSSVLMLATSQKMDLVRLLIKRDSLALQIHQTLVILLTLVKQEDSHQTLVSSSRIWACLSSRIIEALSQDLDLITSDHRPLQTHKCQVDLDQ